MKSGTVIINGINDKELIKILEVKTKFEPSLSFNPQQLQQPVQPPPQMPNYRPPQPGQPPQPQPQPPKEQIYNNAVLNFGDDNGLKGVIEILSHLAGHKAA